MANKNPNKSTRFKPGQSGNPLGRMKLDPALKNFKKLSVEEMENVFTMLLCATESEVERIVEDPKEPYIKRCICQILKKTYEHGSMSTLDMILNRVIGKVKEKIDLNDARPAILRRMDGSEVVFTTQKKDEEE